ncbi:MAG: glutamate 5-kinase [Chloroflexi bacterium]|nr:glutamate 5-kinase [Chloroflexota bacterium]
MTHTLGEGQQPQLAPEAGQATSYRRLVVKVGTSLLTGGSDHLDLEVMASLVGQVARLHQRGAEVLLVSSGAVAAGRHALGLDRGRRDIPFRQVLAAVGQSRLMHAYEQLFGWSNIPVAQALLTRRDIGDRLGYINVRNTLLALLALRVVPIINENDVVASEELEGEAFGDNDTLSAMVANIVDADLLAMLSDIGGLYTADPHLDPSARLIPRVEHIGTEIEAMAGGSASGKGRGGMLTKLEAARLATASGVATVIADGRARDVLLRLAEGEAIGTLFPPATSKLESRQRWMLSVCSPHAAVVVDAGAVRALREQSRSLLPAGIREVRGEFERGEVVPILGPDGQQVAAGMANYSSAELERVRGKRSIQVGAILGHQYGAEAVHRNNMVVL